MTAMWRSSVVGLLLVAAIGGCAADSYPLLTPAGASQWAPTRVGEPVRGVVLYLQPRPGDRLELLTAAPVGQLDNAEWIFYFSPPVFDPADGTTTVGEVLQPLAGSVIEPRPTTTDGPENTFGIVFELRPRVADTFSLTDVVLTFRLNDGPVVKKQGISQTLTVCADDPLPACEPNDEED